MERHLVTGYVYKSRYIYYMDRCDNWMNDQSTRMNSTRQIHFSGKLLEISEPKVMFEGLILHFGFVCLLSVYINILSIIVIFITI